MSLDKRRPRERADWYRISNLAEGPARVDIFDEIGDDGWGYGVSAAAFIADLAKVKGDLEVHINSPGGRVFEAMAIYNAIATRPGNVTTVVDGLAASAASFIAQAGRTRIISPGAMLMIHDAQGLTIGNAADMRETADLLDKASDNLADLYARHSGRPAASWRDAMRAETWYTAEETVAAGLADRIAERPERDALAAVATFDLSIFAQVPDRLRPARENIPAPEPAAPAPGEVNGHADMPAWLSDALTAKEAAAKWPK